MVQAGDDLGNISFVGADGTTMQFGADIKATVESGVGNDDMPAALVFSTNGGTTSTTERMRIDSSGRVGIGTTLQSDTNSSGAGLKIETYLHHNASYNIPEGYYAASLGEVQNTENKVWIAVSSHYARSSAVSAGLFLSAFHQDAGGSGCGSTIKNLKTGNALVFSTVTTAASVGNPAVENERMRIDSSGNVVVGSNSANGSDACTLNSDGEFRGAGFYFSNNIGSPMSSDGIRRATTGTMAFDTASAERMRIDSDGDVGIGTSSPGGNRLKVQLTDSNSNAFVVKGGSGQGRTNIAVHAGNTDGASSTAYRLCNSSGTTIGSFFIMNNLDDLNIMNQSAGGQIIFNTSSTSNSLGSVHRARFDMDGNFFGGKSSSDVNNTGFELKQNGLNAFTRNNGGVLAVNRGTNNGTLISLRRSNSEGGTIGITPSSASFNTSSDYRLKENLQAISDGITRLKTLKPYRFNFKIDATTTVDGFLAHEVTAVPEAITGTKDQVVTQAMIDSGEYEEGTLNDPIYQSIDQSKLVPLLTAALQEEIAKREALEARVAALEAA